MAQVAINNMNPEIAQAYLAMNTIGQQRIKEMLEILILQLAQKNQEDLASFDFNFFDEEAIKLAKQRDSEIENGEVIALSHSDFIALESFLKPRIEAAERGEVINKSVLSIFTEVHDEEIQ